MNWSSLGQGAMSGVLNGTLGTAFGAFNGAIQKNNSMDLMEFQNKLQKDQFNYTFDKQTAYNNWLQQHQAMLSKAGLKEAGISTAGMSDGFTTANAGNNGQLGSVSPAMTSGFTSVGDVSSMGLSISQADLAAATARKTNAEASLIEADAENAAELAEYKRQAAALGVEGQHYDILETKVRTALEQSNIDVNEANIGRITYEMAKLDAEVWRIHELTPAEKNKMVQDANLSEWQWKKLEAESPYFAELMLANLGVLRSQMNLNRELMNKALEEIDNLVKQGEILDEEYWIQKVAAAVARDTQQETIDAINAENASKIAEGEYNEWLNSRGPFGGYGASYFGQMLPNVLGTIVNAIGMYYGLKGAGSAVRTSNSGTKSVKYNYGKDGKVSSVRTTYSKESVHGRNVAPRDANGRFTKKK